MSDLISRQETIDALIKAFADAEDGDEKVECGAYWYHGTVMSIIKSLPSAGQNCVLCEYYTEIETDDGIKGKCTRRTGSDLISRQDAIEAIATVTMSIHLSNVLCDKLLALPSADRLTGEWVSNHDGSWNCSECGLRVFIYAKGNYCPNCGAKMNKGGEDE